MVGIRSGMGEASTVAGISLLRLTATLSPSVRTSAPIWRSIAVICLSPWQEAALSPFTVMPPRLSAPMQRKNAAFDQSPSARQNEGILYPQPPRMA